MSQYLELIQKIHSSPYRFVLVSSGGGTNAISEILKVPGASKSVLEAYVPYAKESLDYYLLKQPDHYCSLGTTLSMAAKAYSAAKKIDPQTNPKNLLGIAVTASLATNYSKKGEHKFFIAIQTYKYSSSFSYSFIKGELTREEEEQTVTDHIIKAIAQACGVQKNLIPENSSLKVKTVEAEKSWVQLVDSKIDFVSSSNRVPELIFPGSFNPFHSGHNSMSELAEKKTGLGLAYEICIQNADKPPLSYHEIEQTLSQFDHGHEWVLTKAGKFTDKAAPTISIPPSVVLPIAYLVQAWATINKSPEPFVTVDGVRMAKQVMYYNSNKAELKLGYKSRSAKEAIRDAIKWFGEHGYLH